jgi:hypothetical protein
MGGGMGGKGMNGCIGNEEWVEEWVDGEWVEEWVDREWVEEWGVS